MTRLQRIKETAVGLALLIAGIIIMVEPSDGYQLIIWLLSFWFVINGLGNIIYYFQMARFMAGGRSMLYLGIIMLDFGILTQSLTDVPHYYVLIYLILVHAFSGLVEILRVLEALRYGSKSWKLKLTHGVINIFMAVICIIFIKHIKTAVFVYSLGIIYSALIRIISACRKTKFIYIQ